MELNHFSLNKKTLAEEEVLLMDELRQSFLEMEFLTVL